MRGFRYNAQQVVVAGRTHKIHLNSHDRKYIAVCCQFGNDQAPVTKILRSGPLKIAQLDFMPL